MHKIIKTVANITKWKSAEINKIRYTYLSIDNTKQKINQIKCAMILRNDFSNDSKEFLFNYFVLINYIKITTNSLINYT